jgi:hypothetical protein
MTVVSLEYQGTRESVLGNGDVKGNLVGETDVGDTVKKYRFGWSGGNVAV